jgi:hypothetical protein
MPRRFSDCRTSGVITPDPAKLIAGQHKQALNANKPKLALVFRVIHKEAKSFSFFFQKEVLVSCSFLKKRTKKLPQMVLIEPCKMSDEGRRRRLRKAAPRPL